MTSSSTKHPAYSLFYINMFFDRSIIIPSFGAFTLSSDCCTVDIFMIAWLLMIDELIFCLRSALLSSKFLNERLNLIGKVGCSLCVVGSTVIVIHSPEDQHVTEMKDLAHKLIDPGQWSIRPLHSLLYLGLLSDCLSVLAGFIVYVCLVAIISLVMIFYYAPKIGQTNVLVYIIICSVVGSLSVMACKGVGLAIMQTFHGELTFLLLSASQI